MKFSTHKMCYVIPAIAILNGCATLSSLWPFGDNKQAESTEAKTEKTGKTDKAEKIETTDDDASIKKAVDKLVAENEKNKQALATNQMEIQSLREQLRTAKRNLQVLNRANRSGLFYEDADADTQPGLAKSNNNTTVDFPNAAGEKQTANAPSGAPGAAAQPSEDVGRSGFSDEDEEGTTQANGAESTNTPATLLASAEQKLQRAQYGEAVVTLTEIQNKFPNYNDNGLVLLLMAEAWLNLKNYNNVFQPVRNFYLKHPSSPDLLRAKLTEAQALEGLGSSERASQLYREVIGTGPQTAYAQKARAALLRLRDSY